MRNGKPLTDEEIDRKIRAGKPFSVLSNQERKKALSAAKFAGIRISSRGRKVGRKTRGPFQIAFFN